MTLFDGNSRLLVGRRALQRWITENYDLIINSVGSLKRKQKLGELLDHLKRSVFPLLEYDAEAMRDLLNVLEHEAHKPVGEKELRTSARAVVNTMVVPIRVAVAFESHRDETLLQAMDRATRNIHQPDRASTKWKLGASSLELRDETVAKLLHTDHRLNEADALYLGPRFRDVSHMSEVGYDPSNRAAAVVAFVNGTGEVPRRVRALFKEAVGVDFANSPRRRADVIVAVVAEGLENAHDEAREGFETTLRDFFGTKKFGEVQTTPEMTQRSADDLLKAAEAEIAVREFQATESPTNRELAIRGAIALAAVGTLRRQFGTRAGSVLRPAALVEKMMSEPFGRQLLAEGIKAWQQNGQVRWYDPASRQPGRRVSPNGEYSAEDDYLHDDDLFALYPISPDAVPVNTGPKTPFQLLDHVRRLLEGPGGMRAALEDLASLPEMTREGLDPEVAKKVLDPLDEARGLLGTLVMVHRRRAQARERERSNAEGNLDMDEEE
ncbi:hypothetical protein GCM10010840_23890 [Deinococcus aerolatus]|uniref:Uncharacterized protein n=1 Tax=Deinococcus aerolatus TaxID=522487 RepID=A0ABQ2GCB1_9DEIO|nr:hypothetical protein [Deinococcus aerolatus]GGL85204.1 hypothetical protein GCM10010840_23890 [Deinococcus aerolatus]